MIVFGQNYHSNLEKYFHLSYYDIKDYFTKDLEFAAKLAENERYVVKINKKIFRKYQSFFVPNLIFYTYNYISELSNFKKKEFEVDVFFSYLTVKPIYIIYFKRKRTNFFVSINSQYSRLIFKSSAGVGRIFGPEKLTAVSVKNLGKRVNNFLLENNLFKNIEIAFQSKPSFYAYKIINILTNNRLLKLQSYRLIKFEHSKGLKLRKKIKK